MGLMQPECLKEHLPSMSTNEIGHRRFVGFDVEKVVIPYEDIGLDFTFLYKSTSSRAVTVILLSSAPTRVMA